MLSYFHRFSVFMRTGENDSNTLRVNGYFFENGKIISVFKSIRIRMDGALDDHRHHTAFQNTLEHFGQPINKEIGQDKPKH